MIVLGDFDARICNLNQGDKQQFNNVPLNHLRSSLDEIENKNGKTLVDIMEKEGLFAINGRTISDSPANYTFIGPIGKSIIDLAWANLIGHELIMDLTTAKRY